MGDPHKRGRSRGKRSQSSKLSSRVAHQVEHDEVLVGVHGELDLRVEVEVARLTRVVMLQHHPLHHQVLLVVVQLLTADLDESWTLDARAAVMNFGINCG